MINLKPIQIVELAAVPVFCFAFLTLGANWFWAIVGGFLVSFSITLILGLPKIIAAFKDGWNNPDKY